MKKLIGLFIFLFSAVIFAQEKDSVVVEVINFSGNLKMGEAFSMHDSSLTFIKVLSDSRCPRQVTCIWPGEAKVLVGVSKNGKYFEKEMIIAGTGTPVLGFQDFEVDALRLIPYPETAEKIAPENYHIKYSISAPVKD